MAEIASVSQRGKFEPFELQVARGQIAWHRAVTVWGYNPDIDTAEETVWADGGVMPFPAAASVIKISSSSANDTSAGTGARTVLISGLDANYNEISDIVTLNGQTAVNTSKSFLRINGMTVLTAGSGNANAGAIYAGDGIVTAGVPATIYDEIQVGYNRALTAAYTVPNGYTAYVVNGGVSAGQDGGTAQITGKLVVRNNGISYVTAVATLNNGLAEYNFTLPLVIEQRQTLEARAFGSSNNNQVAAHFQLILIKNDGA